MNKLLELKAVMLSLYYMLLITFWLLFLIICSDSFTGNPKWKRASLERWQRS